MVIESSDNKYFKLCKSLLTSKGIKKNNLCIISGRKIVPEFINNPAVSFAVAAEKNLSELPQNNNIETKIFKDSLFSELDSCGTAFPFLVYKTPAIIDYDFSPEPEGLEVITGLGDPSNQGALIRSCEAFAVSKIILLKNSCHPFLPKTIKSSSGSSLRAKLFAGPFINKIPSNSFYSLDKNGKSLNNFNWPKNLRLLMGEEGPGFPEDITPIDSLSIPMEPGPESLNATIATSIALNSYYQSK